MQCWPSALDPLPITRPSIIESIGAASGVFFPPLPHAINAAIVATATTLMTDSSDLETGTATGVARTERCAAGQRPIRRTRAVAVGAHRATRVRGADDPAVRHRGSATAAHQAQHARATARAVEQRVA